MPHKYDNIVGHLHSVFAEMDKIGLGDVLPKGGVGAILLAHKLGHELVPGDKGADAYDDAGQQFEYKVSITDQFNFHFGARREKEDPKDAVTRHFTGIAGAYCAKRKGGTFLRIVYCPADSLVADLSAHFAATKGGQLNKNYDLDALTKLSGAKSIC